jgi:putative ABC transport system permease protein
MFKRQVDYAVFTYPVIPALVTALVIIIICVLTPEAVYRSVVKTTVVERLREAE